jgi:hypothetical protein
VARNLTTRNTSSGSSRLSRKTTLTIVPGCFARLRAFDPAWQARQRHRSRRPHRLPRPRSDRHRPLDGLFDRPEPFGILQGVNASNPCPYNGSVWWTTAGYRPDVWTDFSLEAARAVPFDSFTDDQAWLAHKLPRAASIGPEQGVYGFCKPGWPRGTALPKNASIVAFPGWRDPAGFTHLDWVKEHWAAC